MECQRFPFSGAGVIVTPVLCRRRKSSSQQKNSSDSSMPASFQCYSCSPWRESRASSPASAHCLLPLQWMAVSANQLDIAAADACCCVGSCACIACSCCFIRHVHVRSVRASARSWALQCLLCAPLVQRSVLLSAQGPCHHVICTAPSLLWRPLARSNHRKHDWNHCQPSWNSAAPAPLHRAFHPSASVLLTLMDASHHSFCCCNPCSGE